MRSDGILASLDATGLPLVPFLPEVGAALASRGMAVLVAEPGSGKSTLVPLRLAAEGRSSGKVLVLEPRRVAAASVASRAADIIGEPAGETVGYRVRMEARTSSRTRVEYLTEGLLARIAQGDPSFRGVSVVVFDEFHERSIHTDLALALALDAKAMGAPIAILLMSATMDASRIASFLGDADGGDAVPVLDCPGTIFPVRTIHAPLPGRDRIGRELARTLPRILQESEGDVLAFLPGAGEIADAASELRGLLDDRTTVEVLHGSLPLAEQKRILAPRSEGAHRLLVLATNVAETSLTVPGVRVVVDAGLVRLPRLHRRSAMDQLSLEAASLHSCDQRRGRAGRLGPGLCFRLWDPSTPRPLETESEILRSELSSLVLECAIWGGRGPGDLAFLDPPRQDDWDAARALLSELGALDSDGAVTERGRRMASLGTHPRLAAMILQGRDRGQAPLACALAALLSERDGSGIRGDADLRRRLDLLSIQGLGASGPWVRRVRTLASDFLSRLGASVDERGRASTRGGSSRVLHWSSEDAASAGLLVALAFPDRIARNQGEGVFRFPSGREARVEGPLRGEEWIVAPDVEAGERSGRIFLAAPLDGEDAEDVLGPQIQDELSVQWEDLVPRLFERRLAGRLMLAERRVPLVETVVRDSFAKLVLSKGLSILPWNDGDGRASRRLERIRFFIANGGIKGGAVGVSIPSFSEESLLAELENWLSPYLRLAPKTPVVDGATLVSALDGRLGADAFRLDALVPEYLTTPAGSRRRIDYGTGEPALDVRIQEVFGLAETPRILGVPLLLRLLSPAQRPLQITKDLRGFWSGSYAEVRKEMRGRYPRHYWPENPLEAEPTTRAKPRR